VMKALSFQCLLCSLAMAMPVAVHAQMTHAQQTQIPESDPNSAYYNTRYLPALGASQSSDRIDDRFGAFAMSRRTGWSGWFQDARSEQAAGLAALEQCRLRSGGAIDCEIVLTFQNQCAAVVRSERHTGYGRAGDLMSARGSAMRRCEALGGRCEVFREGCTYPDMRR